VLLFVIGRRLGGARAGLLAAAIYGVLTATGNPRLLATNTELLMMLPLTASFLLMLQRRWLWSGALLVTAGAFRQVAAANLLLVPLAVLLLEPRETRARASVRFGAGLLAALVAGGALLALTGSITGFWRWTVGSLCGYATGSWVPSLVWMRLKDSLLPFAIELIVPWAAALVWAWRWKRLAAEQRLAAAWLPVSFAGAIAGGHLSWHYFIQVMGPLALLAALAFDHALDTRWRRWAAAVAAAGLGIPLLAWGAFNTVADPLTYDFSAPVPQHEQVAAYIHEHTRPDDRIFVWGNWPALHVESDRLMASRFPGFLRGFARGSGLPPNNWDTTPDVWPELQADLTRHPPALIVDTAAAGWSDFSAYPMRNYPVVATLVASDYHQVAVIDGVVIYARDEGG
jgi:hypothetical protein